MNDRVSINYDVAILWGDIFSMIAEQEIYIFLSSNPNISNFVLVKFNIFRGILLFNIIYYFVKKDVKKEMLKEKVICYGMFWTIL